MRKKSKIVVILAVLIASWMVLPGSALLQSNALTENTDYSTVVLLKNPKTADIESFAGVDVIHR